MTMLYIIRFLRIVAVIAGWLLGAKESVVIIVTTAIVCRGIFSKKIVFGLSRGV